jgi:hypothetical protein
MPVGSHFPDRRPAVEIYQRHFLNLRMKTPRVNKKAETDDGDAAILRVGIAEAIVVEISLGIVETPWQKIRRAAARSTQKH